MGEILKFELPEKTEPHVTGEALCLGCRREWVCVAPVGVFRLECPSCGLMRGVFKQKVGAGPDEKNIICMCDCEYFVMIRKKDHNYILCSNCGNDVTMAIFD
jgi:hypothetical protein